MNRKLISFSLVSLITLICLGEIGSITQAQSITSAEFKQRFVNTVTNLHQEKVFVHTDRTHYITGETIWMSFYCVDAATHHPVDMSKVLSVELISEKGEPLKQDRIRLEAGFGKGQMFISPDLPSGSYTLRAYTNWMKNFDADFVFKKELVIINPASVPESNDTHDLVDQMVINFFPEGGDLVNGLQSRVAVKVENGFGEGKQLSGLIFDNNDTEVAKFTTSNKGYASFNLTPESGKLYKAKIAHEGSIQEYALPAIKKSGLVIAVTNRESEELSIRLNSTPDFSQRLHLLIHTRGIIKHTELIILSSQRDIELPFDILSPGISHITVMDQDFNPLVERLVFKHPKTIPDIGLVTKKTDYQKREKVDLSFNTQSLKLNKAMDQISVAVFRKSDISQMENNIISNLLLTSDLKGKISNPSSYFNKKGQSQIDEIDLLMLTHGWRRFSWGDVKTNKQPETKYPAELNAPIISGRLINNSSTELPSSLLMSFTGKASVISLARIAEEGSFHFEVPFRINNKKVHFFYPKDSLEDSQIEISSPFDLAYNKVKTQPARLKIELKEYLESLNSNIQIAQVYRGFNKINGSPTVVDSIKTHFYGQADYLYLLDDYTRFETVKDLFIEYIRSVIIRKKNKKFEFKVLNENLKSGESLTMIDGVPILEAQFILDFDPLKMKKIEVVNDVYYIGGKGYDGIINFSTYDGNLAGESLPDYLIERAYNGLQQTRQFYSPNYAIDPGRLKRIPDFRNTLYWNPDARVSNKGQVDLEFYTSDDAGTYQIEVNGITEDGQAIYIKDTFIVGEDLPK